MTLDCVFMCLFVCFAQPCGDSLRLHSHILLCASKEILTDREIWSSSSPSDTCERQAGIRRTVSTPSLPSKHERETTQRTDPSDIFRDRDGHPPVQDRLQDTSPHRTKSCLVNHSKEQVSKRNIDDPLKLTENPISSSFYTLKESSVVLEQHFQYKKWVWSQLIVLRVQMSNVYVVITNDH